MTTEQLHILRHSLGLTDKGKGTMYRNHFVAGGDDERICRELVASGHMVEGRRSAITGGDPVFFVTEQGKVIAQAKPRRTLVETGAGQ